MVIELFRFWSSEIALYLLPVPACIIMGAILVWQYWRYREFTLEDLEKAIILGVPIPLAITYFLFFGQIPNGFSLTKVFAPQAFILGVVGIWLLFKAGRGRDFSPLSWLSIVLIAFVGHMWTVIAIHAVK